MYKLTNNNIRLRYLAERHFSRLRRKAGEDVPLFTFAEMGRPFMVGKQACYQWTKNTMPKGVRTKMVYDWINDGAIDAFMKVLEADEA